MENIKPDKKYLGYIVKVVSDIVGDQTMVLQRVERAIQEQNKAYKALLNQLGVMDKKIEDGFNVLETNRIASFDKNVTQKIFSMDYDYLKQLKDQLNSVCNRLQQQIHTKLLHLVIKQSQGQWISQQVIAPISRPMHAISAAPSPSKPSLSMKSGSVIVKEETPTVITKEDGWTESELEGAEVFDTIIIGWKQKDWNSAKGTREEFMRAWKKLSSTDKQKIRQGAWSKQIIDKMKMLGRKSIPKSIDTEAEES